MDATGALFGTTAFGGTNDRGVAFKFDQVTSQYTVLHNFCTCSDGGEPNSGLTLDATGNLFGTTFYNGANGDGGTVFELSGTTFTVLYSFCSKQECSDGKQPSADLSVDDAGDLFGTTSAANASVFELKP